MGEMYVPLYEEDCIDKGFEDLVDLFSSCMKARFQKEFKKGKRGWADARFREMFIALLKENVEKEEWVDVANYAAFLWNFEWRLE